MYIFFDNWTSTGVFGLGRSIVAALNDVQIPLSCYDFC